MADQTSETNGGDMTSQKSEGQLQVRFVTKEQQYSISSNVFDIKRQSTVDDLNKIVNSVIKSTNADHEDLQFNFLTNGYLIKTKLDEHLDIIFQESGEEKIVEVEYLVRNQPPEPFKSLNYLDWVGCIHSNKEYILSGCYDGSINIFSIVKNKHLLSVDAHLAAIKGIRIFENSQINQHFSTKSNELYFVSTSFDETCKIWKWVASETNLHLLFTCKGHIRSVNCVDVFADMFVTGSNDNMIKIWNLKTDSYTKQTDETESKSKKAKNVESSIKHPHTTLAGHNEGISDVCWLKGNSDSVNSIPDIASCSFDSTIKIWDMQTLELKTSLPAPKAILSLDYSSTTKLIIAGLCDNHLRMFDPRAKEGNIVKAAYSSHTGWISSVCWQNESDYLFASGSFDSKLKQWDIRSTKAPLFDLVGHEGRILAVDWSNENYMCSGASDCFMKVYRASP